MKCGSGFSCSFNTFMMKPLPQITYPDYFNLMCETPCREGVTDYDSLLENYIPSLFFLIVVNVFQVIYNLVVCFFLVFY